MKSRLALLIPFLTSTVLAQTPTKPALILTPEEVAKLVLTQSYRVKEVNADADLARLPYANALGIYDFTLLIESGVEKSKVENVGQNQNWDLSDSYLTTISLKKTFSTGTIVNIDALRNSVRYELLPTAPATAIDQYNQNSVGLTLTQNLWRNYFGAADRADLDAAKKTYQASIIQRANNLQDLVLEALRAFWNAYVAQETFQESLNVRDRYGKLVDVVRRKTTYGSANPGEFPQVQAESELRIQNVKTNSAEYLRSLDALATLLNLPAGTEIKFKALEDVSAPPKLTTVEIEGLRAVRASRLRKEAADSAYTSASARNRADVSLVGKVYSTGLDESLAESDNELLAGRRPRYYVGVKYEYKFGSGANDETILNKRLSRELEGTRYDRLRRETVDNLLNKERNVQALYNVAVSAKNQRQLRERAATELNRTYTQGRTDISILIEAMNKLFQSQIDHIRAVGNYQIALNEWAALRDELIPEASVTAPQVQPPLTPPPENAATKEKQ